MLSHAPAPPPPSPGEKIPEGPPPARAAAARAQQGSECIQRLLLPVGAESFANLSVRISPVCSRPLSFSFVYSYDKDGKLAATPPDTVMDAGREPGPHGAPPPPATAPWDVSWRAAAWHGFAQMWQMPQAGRSAGVQNGTHIRASIRSVMGPGRVHATAPSQQNVHHHWASRHLRPAMSHGRRRSGQSPQEHGVRQVPSRGRTHGRVHPRPRPVAESRG